MSQPVKLSDALVLDARIAGEAQERSIARQVEFWAKLGKSVDLLLDGRRLRSLLASGAVQPLSEALASVDTPAGRKRVQDVIASRPFPHYRQYAGQPGLLVRIDQDGTETVGRFLNRVFTAVGDGVADVSRELRVTEAGAGKKRIARGPKDNSRAGSKAQKAWA
jgi:hypothetical protein